MPVDRSRLEAGLRTATEHLLGEMRRDGWWEGELSPSALATATAITALAVLDRPQHAPLIRRGEQWLVANQNADGGWGDSPESPSNLSTTLLAVSALTLCGDDSSAPARKKADAYLAGRGVAQPGDWPAALARAYGKDRTFAVPILIHAAVAGLVPWDRIPRLPFELAVVPRRLYRLLRLHVVSYALPALIAVGLALHRNHPPRSAFARALRQMCIRPALRRLRIIQPAGGGFLEAVPLTSFVAMSLAASSLHDHPVTAECVRFIVARTRPDGSWPVDSNLSVWVTTNAVIALDAASALDQIDRGRTRTWLLAQERGAHPYTGAGAGGWAWTHLPGGVPDADDTARALLALALLDGTTAPEGVRWLLDLQNRDGGWPTFCRGWGKLPFDRSSPDLTAHALSALARAHEGPLAARVRRAVRRGIAYLRRMQQSNGAWGPLWFGSQLSSDMQNPVLGTAAALPALAAFGERGCVAKGTAYLLGAQNADGGWGGHAGVPSSVEETACAVSALAQVPDVSPAISAIDRGVIWLLDRLDEGTWLTPSPVGLYFAKLWYSERLYPIIWTVEALGRAAAIRRLANG